MSSTTPLTDGINTLITRANNITGASDTTLNIAIERLASGYGGDDALTFLLILDRSAETINSTKITKLGKNALNGFSNLTSINLPNLTEITGDYCIVGTKITSLYLPNLTTMGGNSIRDNNQLLYLVLPKCVASGWHMYRSNRALIAADFTDVVDFGTDSFRDDLSMNILILRKTDSITSLSSINAFSNSPFAVNGTIGAGGTIYVPQALISSYQSATNWSTILESENNQILPIEGSIYETQYADGTLIPTT